MIILPQRDRAVGKLLMPMRPAEWREPSKRIDTWGIRNVTRWRLTARADDGFVVWRGWFDDRDDADAFLFAVFSGSLRGQRALWDLPVPAWRPDLGEGLHYDFVTMTFITSPLTLNTNYTIPADWNSGSNSEETIGGGASGGGSSNGTQVPGVGGGAGAYAKSLNYSAAPGALVNFQIGAGGPGIKQTGVTYVAGIPGGNTWFGNTSFASSFVGATAGTAWPTNMTPNATSAGGQASASIGNSTKNNGGGGKNGNGPYVGVGGGGGAAAGANGPGADGGGTPSTGATVANGGGGGANGGSVGGTATTTVSAPGGNNRLGTGAGAAGTASVNGGAGLDGAGGGGGGSGAFSIGGNGGPGSEWDASHGSGGGGGGAGATPYKGGSGGLYGGGGGGGSFNTANGPTGAGAQGILVITYTPGTTGKGGLGNIPMGF